MARQIGGYDLIERLGQGGMGEVWRAYHRRLAREAAIKFVRREGLPAGFEAIARTRLEAEARMTAALGSPHTIRVFDFGATPDGEPFCVMELLRGCDLEALVRRFGPLPSDRALYLLEQACHSLAEAHDSGLVHGDIKPANIYVCRLGLEYDFAKVLDFGLARAEQSNDVHDSNLASDIGLGTPAYMAPEMIAGNRVDRRADVYALGCVAYFLLTGERVFRADTLSETVSQHLYSDPIPPSKRSECFIPRALDVLVLACLRKDPNLRPQDAGELSARIAAVSRGAWNQRSASNWWKTHLPEASVESHGSVMCPSLDVCA
jgi:eukaryotic-like serine/threonine-protein kinase